LAGIVGVLSDEQSAVIVATGTVSICQIEPGIGILVPLVHELVAIIVFIVADLRFRWRGVAGEAEFSFTNEETRA